MSVTRALLTFWFRPLEATRVLEARLVGWAAPLLPAAGFGIYLWARGCQPHDATAGAVAVLLLLFGLGLGGGAASYPASFLTGASFRPLDRIGPCLVFAAWAFLLFVVLLVFGGLLGAGGQTPLFGALVLVLWGGAAGTAVVGGEQAEDSGRALVASCVGLAGSLAGLWAALLLIQAQLLLVAPAPTDVAGMAAGDPMLVRREAASDPGEMVLLVDAGEAILARVELDGGFRPLGPIKPRFWASYKGDTVGRVFFHFGGFMGGTVVSPEHSPQTFD